MSSPPPASPPLPSSPSASPPASPSVSPPSPSSQPTPCTPSQPLSTLDAPPPPAAATKSSPPQPPLEHYPAPPPLPPHLAPLPFLPVPLLPNLTPTLPTTPELPSEAFTSALAVLERRQTQDLSATTPIPPLPPSIRPAPPLTPLLSFPPRPSLAPPPPPPDSIPTPPPLSALASFIPAPPPLHLPPSPSPFPHRSPSYPSSLPSPSRGPLSAIFSPRDADTVPFSSTPSAARLRHRRAGPFTRLPSSDPPAADEQVMTLLSSIGFRHYAELFASKRIAGEMLASLTNTELRDDLGISCLRHRREILSAIAATTAPSAATLPEFGRILVHLSNTRNLLSWLSLGLQHATFSLALIRVAPQLRPSGPVLVSALYVAFAGLSAAVYGFNRYRLVCQIIDDDGKMTRHRFVADTAGVYFATIGCLATAAFVMFLIWHDGFTLTKTLLPPASIRAQVVSVDEMVLR